MAYNAQELTLLLTEIRRSFISNGVNGDMGRDQLWDHRRNLRHRREPAGIPRDLKIIKSMDLDFRDVLPEQVVSRIKSRLGTNSVDLNVRIRGKPSPKRLQATQKLRDWFMGAMEELDPLGVKDTAVRDHQAADGVGFFELELRPTFNPPMRNPRVDDKEYDEMVEDARRGYGLPVSLSAPDPRSLYYVETQGRMKVVAKIVNVPLIDVSGAYTAEGFKLAYNQGTSGQGQYVKVPITGDTQPPMTMPWDYGRKVRFVRIADDDNIYDCMFPVITAGAPDVGLSLTEFAASAGVQGSPQLEILATYPNKLGHPPFYWAPARLEPHPDPALRCKPLAAEILDMAGYVNSIRSMQMVRGALDALAPVQYDPAPSVIAGQDPMDSKQRPLRWEPGIQTLPGKLNAMPQPLMSEFDKFDDRLSKEYQSYQYSILSAAQSGVLGGHTPAWTVMMINEDNNGFLVEALNNRAGAIEMMLMDMAKVCLMRGEPVYVLAHQMDPKSRSEEYDEMISVTPEDLKIPFILDVKIHAETQSQNAAATEYYRLLHQEGSISDETYFENIGIEDTIAEQQRKDYESISRPMKAAGLWLGFELAKQELLALYPPELVEPVIDAMIAASGNQPLQVEAQATQMGEVSTGLKGGPVRGPAVPVNAPGGNNTLGKGPSSPGQGQGLTLPDHVTNFGGDAARRMPNPNANVGAS